MPPNITTIQRAITVEFISKRRLNAPAVWLRPESSSPTAEDQVQSPDKLNTVLQDWLGPNEDRNLGIRLIGGFVELQITSPDDIWAKCFFEACESLQVDARVAFGSASRVSSVIFSVDKPTKLPAWEHRWPRGHRDKAGAWVATKLLFSASQAKGPWIDSQPLPGSRFGNHIVVWRPKGKPATDDGEIGLEDLEYRPLATTNVESICRAIAFATLAYWIRIDLDGLTEWDESLNRLIGGWMANLAREGRAINEQGKSLEGVCWAPVDSPDTVSALLNHLGVLGAKKDLGVSFLRAEAALERNPQAPIANWRAIETRFGPQAMVGIRHAFRAGIDISVIEEMSARYVLDASQHVYIDREALLKGNAYEHKHDDLVRLWDNKTEFVNNKPQNPFRLYARSSLRTDVSRQEFCPGGEPGGLLRFSPVHGLLNGERAADEYPVLNIFPGFHITPIATIDEEVMRVAVSMLDRMLGLLTQDNDAQILWLKKFVAWIIQHPGIKQQVCPVIVGGQGIGKSLFGGALMRALFGEMAGSTNGSALKDDKFLVTPFIGKLITFLDEVRLEAISAINEIKKLIREDRVSGQRKFKDQQTYYLPSRLMIAANQPNIGLTPEDAADRAFFFIISWTAENKRMTDREFQAWSLTLKPFYGEFVKNLESVVFKRHLMRYLTDLEVTREELEDLTYSSRDDENVVKATMSKAREVARLIVADARVLQGEDITKWFTMAALREAVRRVDGPRTKVEAGQVLMEYERANVIENIRGDMYKFRYRYATLVKKLGEAHGLPITNHWDYEPDDYGDNDVMSPMGGRGWRGNRQQSKAQPDYRKREDPDRMDPF